MSKFFSVVGMAAAVMLGTGTSAEAKGVGGVGNSTDISIQLELVKETAIHILQRVSVSDLVDASQPFQASELYRGCRDTMYRGAVGTSFRLVDSIPDGEGYHALARRASGYETWFSRRELERLSGSGTLSSSLLILVFLHEVSHDCVIQGHALDDGDDPSINIMVNALYQVARQTQNGVTRDIEFVSNVQQGNPVQFPDLSQDSQRVITEAYINYLGDWLYEKYRANFPTRMAPASDFYATSATSVYPGWGYVRESGVIMNPEVEGIVFNVLRPSFEDKTLAYYLDFGRVPLPTYLNCRIKTNPVENLKYADCALVISWHIVEDPALSKYRHKLTFQLDSLGRVQVTQIWVN